MTFRVIQQGDMTGLNAYIFNTNSKHIKQKQLKVEIGKFTVIVGDFLTKLSL